MPTNFQLCLMRVQHYNSINLALTDPKYVFDDLKTNTSITTGIDEVILPDHPLGYELAGAILLHHGEIRKPKFYKKGCYVNLNMQGLTHLDVLVYRSPGSTYPETKHHHSMQWTHMAELIPGWPE